MLKVRGVGVAFGDRFLRALMLEMESEGAVELALRLNVRTARVAVGGAVAVTPFVRAFVSRVADERVLVVRDTRVDVVDGARREDMKRFDRAPSWPSLRENEQRVVYAIYKLGSRN